MDKKKIAYLQFPGSNTENETKNILQKKPKKIFLVSRPSLVAKLSRYFLLLPSPTKIKLHFLWIFA